MSASYVLKSALECLEDTLSSPALRQKSYMELQRDLNSGDTIDQEAADRLLAVCIRDLQEDSTTTNALTIISSLLEKIKKGQCSITPVLVSSAISVITLLEAIASVNKFDTLKGIMFNTLLLYPDSTLICVAADSTDKVFDFLNAYILAGNKVVPVTFLTTLLKILPPVNKMSFVKKGLPLWFTNVIPLAMNSIQTYLHMTIVTSCVELLELLTEVLVDIEYSENPHWKILIECIYNPKKYPSILKSLLETKCDFWHRLWIIFVKLLKNQITKISTSGSSPINSMLPVVETAYKMEPDNRCRAFQCWSVLIDTFSMESNEVTVNKRLKLLVVPLKLYNAKEEETAIAKFNTWWHLIRQFHCRMESLTEMVLIPFIHFCFGKSVPKSPMAPGQFSETLKDLSVEALVEVFGHVDCEGCVAIPKLKSRLISTKILVDYWNNWICCLKITITTAVESNSKHIKQQITCIWTSFVMTVGELPDNNIRKDLFTELLELISLYIKGCQKNSELADIVMDILIKSLYKDNIKISSLLKTKETGPMYLLLKMLSSSFADECYKGKSMDELLSFFMPVTTFMMDDILCCPNRITTWILDCLPANDNNLVLWMALAEAVCKSKNDLAVATLIALLLYPIQQLNKYSNEKSTVAAYKWFTTYSQMSTKLENANLDKECVKMISEQFSDVQSKVFILHISLVVVKQKVLRKMDEECEHMTQIFLNSLSSIDTFSSIEKVFPALIDTLILMGNKLTDNINVPFAKLFVLVVKVAVKLLLQETINDTTIIFVEKMLRSLLDIVKVKEYHDLILIINDEILTCSTISNKYASKIKSSLLILTSHLPDKSNTSTDLNTATIDDKISSNDRHFKKVAEVINEIKEDNMKSFNTPEVKTYSKKRNKRAASIVNTVVENGEEYVVVKSNWKFNPRKLTENQKEKLKRKREDIPALYQDLSQSQDEFKLSAWKTDSQDTISSKSTSKSNNEDASTILSQIPNTDVVPRIFENILADSAKINVDDRTSGDSVIVNNNVQKQATSNKKSKSPRLALKDRVFRNVRNLVDKSSLQNDGMLPTDDINYTIDKNNAKTPKNKAKSSCNVLNSVIDKSDEQKYQTLPTEDINKTAMKESTDKDLTNKAKLSFNVGNSVIDMSGLQKDGTLPTDDMNKSVNENTSKTPITQVKISAKDVNSAAPNQISERPSRVIKKPKKFDNTEVITLRKRRRSQLFNCAYSQSDNFSESQSYSTGVLVTNNEGVNQNIVQMECDNNVCGKNNDDFELNQNYGQDSQNQDILPGTQLEGCSLLPSNCVPVSEQNEGKHDIVDISTAKETPTLKTSDKANEEKLPSAKNKSRIVKQLEIDMVEWLPFCQAPLESEEDTPKRATRKTPIKTTNNKTKRQALSDEKFQSDLPITPLPLIATKATKKQKDKVSLSPKKTESEEKQITSFSSDDQPMSEDVIESSQDSCITTISIKSSKIIPKKLPVVILDKADILKMSPKASLSKDKFNSEVVSLSDTSMSCKEDSRFAKNVTIEKPQLDQTENMDTQPLEDKESHSDEILVKDVEEPMVINTENSYKEPSTQQTAEADTEPTDITVEMTETEKSEINSEKDLFIISSAITQDDTIKIISECLESLDPIESMYSPSKDERERKQDFLNNTQELSPIKTICPLREKQSPSPETSSDYIVIELTSPVHSNGEPFEKCDSPEVFTEDKISPDKRNESPPRVEVILNNSSPSSSLSLKKNRPQRPLSGRAAQMLDLCAIMNDDSVDLTDTRNNTPLNTPAKRNLKSLYNSSEGDASENTDIESESMESEKFLKFKRSLPTADCSPAGPILKRKFTDITDETTTSPASKRKRVSFHDPPVSTTVAVQKYIEPGAIRSPQHSTIKRRDMPARRNNMKSPKKLETVFKLDSVLSKAVKSFSEESVVAVIEDTELSSIEQTPTPAFEVIQTSDLNDTDPMCPALLGCNDPIENIAAELSSPAMKLLFIKEIDGKVGTIADLAKMTALEINRLCIKTPKVQVARKVLLDYAFKRVKSLNPEQDNLENETVLTQKQVKIAQFDKQTSEVEHIDSGMQTDATRVAIMQTQTDFMPVSHTSAQTDESGCKSTSAVIACCLSERPDFITQLSKQLEFSSVQKIADNTIPFSAMLEMLSKKMTVSNSVEVTNKVLEVQSKFNLSCNSTQNKLAFVQNYLCNHFDSRDLLLFCSQLLQKVYDKPT